MGGPVVIFLTDYGLRDDFVGVCHGVIAQGCPQARVIDLSHGIGPQDVRAGALTLARALPYLPEGVCLAVVDPGVGGPRRAIAALAADGRRFVGPDNGLLWPATQASGGVEAVVDVGRSPLVRTPTSATFHGRDVFAPVAAALAGGAELSDVGEPVDPGSVVALAPSRTVVHDGIATARVASVDAFGNLSLDGEMSDLVAAGIGERARIELGDGTIAVAAVGERFGDVADGELLLYVDSYGSLAIAVNGASAAQRLGAGRDTAVSISAAP